MMTDEQRQRRRVNHMENYNYRKELGLCPIYGCKNDANPGNVLCKHHLEMRSQHNHKTRSKA